ncbi:MAG: hypothetical protein Q8L73_00105 [Methylotenera sp.]|nr:hypothetical protein [Methylotenera sp.]
MKNKPTRAQRMAEQYGKKLEAISGIKLAPQLVRHDDNETPEMLAKRKLAMEKLSTFRDLL